MCLRQKKMGGLSALGGAATLDIYAEDGKKRFPLLARQGSLGNVGSEL